MTLVSDYERDGATRIGSRRRLGIAHCGEMAASLPVIIDMILILITMANTNPYYLSVLDTLTSTILSRLLSNSLLDATNR